MRLQRQKGQVRCMCHPELSNEIGAGGFEEEEGNSQGRCLEKEHMFGQSMFALPYRWVIQIKFISDNSSNSEKDFRFRFF